MLINTWVCWESINEKEEGELRGKGEKEIINYFLTIAEILIK